MKYAGSSSPFFVRCLRRSSIGLAVVALLVGCQSVPQTLKVTPTPQTLLYSYIITNGMARGRMMADRPDMVHLLSLISADHVALKAVITAVRLPSRSSFEQANEAMVRYLAEIENNGPPPQAGVGAPVPALKGQP